MSFNKANLIVARDKMYKILKKKVLTKDVKLFGIEASHITFNAKAGNFVVVIVDEKGERIPLTIYDWDKEKGIVYIIFQEIGMVHNY